jgi:predicted lipoprotein with Yx(FWY)xxD motif
MPAAGSTVAVGSTSLGKVLVSRTGLTLYLFTRDKPGSGKSACSGACTAVWPPLTTTGAPTAGSGANGRLLGTITRKPGVKQVTYDGWPLYRYIADTGPGQVSGEGLYQFGARWYAVSPAGTEVNGTGSPSGSAYG